MILPPAYKGDVPEGYHVAQSDTYGNWVIWRGFQVDGDPKPAVETNRKIFRMYSLSQKDNPPTMNFINVSGKNFNTIHRTDYKSFEEINEVVQAEPSEGQDPEILGQLASIGIKKGQPFKPDEWLQTVPGKGWNMLFRLYGPLQPWFDKSWRPGDPVEVK